MFHDLMREESFQRIITIGFIGGHQRLSLTDRLSHETSHASCRSVRSIIWQTTLPLRAIAPITAIFSEPPLICRFLIPVPVFIFPANECFVHFDFAHQLCKPSVPHCRTNAMAHIPGGLIGPAARSVV